MRTSGLPTFLKLWGRNNHDVMAKENYQITVNLNFPVLLYKGTKSIVISAVSWIGGKNPFLGWAYVRGLRTILLSLDVSDICRFCLGIDKRTIAF